MSTGNLQTDLIGARIEMKDRREGDSWWTDNRDTSRGSLTGTIRSIGIGDDGIFVFQIEDDDGWVHTRSSSSNLFRVINHDPVETFARLEQLMVGDVFRFDPVPSGWTDQRLLIVEKPPAWAMPEGWDFFVWPIPEAMRYHRVILLDDVAPTPTGPSVPEETP